MRRGLRGIRTCCGPLEQQYSWHEPCGAGPSGDRGVAASLQTLAETDVYERAGPLPGLRAPSVTGRRSLPILCEAASGAQTSRGSVPSYDESGRGCVGVDSCLPDAGVAWHRCDRLLARLFQVRTVGARRRLVFSSQLIASLAGGLAPCVALADEHNVTRLCRDNVMTRRHAACWGPVSPPIGLAMPGPMEPARVSGGSARAFPGSGPRGRPGNRARGRSAWGGWRAVEGRDRGWRVPGRRRKLPPWPSPVA